MIFAVGFFGLMISVVGIFCALAIYFLGLKFGLKVGGAEIKSEERVREESKKEEKKVEKKEGLTNAEQFFKSIEAMKSEFFDELEKDFYNTLIVLAQEYFDRKREDLTDWKEEIKKEVEKKSEKK